MSTTARYVVALQLTRIDKIEMEAFAASNWKAALIAAIIIVAEGVHRSSVTLMDGVSLGELKATVPSYIAGFPEDVEEARKVAHSHKWDFKILEVIDNE